MNLHEYIASGTHDEQTRLKARPSGFSLAGRYFHESERPNDVNYDGQKLHFVQIGLGTNSTFIQNIVGDRNLWCPKVHFLLSQGSLWNQDKYRTMGIAVEPVASLVEDLQPLASKLPGVRLLQAAIGEDAAQEVPIFGLSNRMREDALRQVFPQDRSQLIQSLEYIRNMSCLEMADPLLLDKAKCIESKYNVRLDIERLQTVDIWTWGQLVEYFNFVGCEVVLIDAEGYDTKIMRSLLSYCKDRPEHWPDLIAFETMGHCDKREAPGSENAILEEFGRDGYIVVSMSDYDSYIIRATALDQQDRLQWWVNQWKCDRCTQKWKMPYMCCSEGIFCKKCYIALLEDGKSQSMYISRLKANAHACPDEDSWWYKYLCGDLVLPESEAAAETSDHIQGRNTSVFLGSL